MKLTKEQREQLVEALNMPYASVKLRCDGREITLIAERSSEARISYLITVYIDGEWRGAWTKEEPSIPEHKFMRREERYVHSLNYRKQVEKDLPKLKRTLGAKFANDLHRNYDAKIVMYAPFFNTASAAITQLCKVCDSVEIIAPEALVTL